jgi:cytoskeletal protein RodZ
MFRDRTRLALVLVLLLAVGLAVVFSVRGNIQAPPPSPTDDLGAVQTHAVSTFASGLTATVQAIPSSTSTATSEPVTEAATATAGTGTAATAATQGTPTPSCYRLKFLQDVTIPDNTAMTPAQVFTKTWQVQNTGLCAWRTGFKLVLIGGDAMGGSPYVLPATTNPGAKVELSVKMAAPTNQTGIVQGTWRMSDDNGGLFGDALTVVIVVGNGTGAAPTSPATANP